MDKYDMQIRAIRYAIKELKRDLTKAQATRDSEWIDDCESHIEALEAAILSVEAVKALHLALGHSPNS